MKRDSKTLPHWPNQQPLALWAITVWEAYERERERESLSYLYFQIAERERERERETLTGILVSLCGCERYVGRESFLLFLSFDQYKNLYSVKEAARLSEKATDYYDYDVVDLTICYCYLPLAVHEYVFCMTKLALSFLDNDRSDFFTF